MPGYIIGSYPGNNSTFIPYGESYMSGAHSPENASIIIHFPFNEVIPSSFIYQTTYEIYPIEWTFSGSSDNQTWTELIYKNEHMCPPEYRTAIYINETSRDKDYCQVKEFSFDFINKHPFKYIKFTLIRNSYYHPNSAYNTTIINKGIEITGEFTDIFSFCTSFCNVPTNNNIYFIVAVFIYM